MSTGHFVLFALQGPLFLKTQKSRLMQTHLPQGMVGCPQVDLLFWQASLSLDLIPGVIPLFPSAHMLYPPSC